MSDLPKIEARTIVVDMSKRPKPQPDPRLDALLKRYPNFPYDAPKWRLDGASFYDIPDVTGDEPQGAA